MSSQPVIGITVHSFTQPDLSVPGVASYVASVVAAGGAPVLLPVEADSSALLAAAAVCDGLILSGGHDIDPTLYHEERDPHLGPIDRRHDDHELALLTVFLELRKPVLGICRGLQLLNVAAGGTLYQHLPTYAPSSIAHEQETFTTIPHTIQAVAGTHLAAIIGTEPVPANSAHHQAIHRPGHHVIPSAYAPDGLIEGVEYPDYPFVIGVQHHPEALADRDAASAALFRAFVQAARQQ